MFTPQQFLNKPKPAINQPGSRLVLQKLTDHSKSRWDQPLNVPDVLYMKFKINPPQNKKQHNYPSQLIDFIKRSYDRCKDETQTKNMENQLRVIISKYEDELMKVDWENYPVPILQEQKKSIFSFSNVREPMIKKQILHLPKEYSESLGIDKVIEKQPSAKTKTIVSKTLQKLEQRLSKTSQGKLQPQQTKKFIGFKNQPQIKPASYIRSQIKPSLKIVLPPPPPPKHQPPQTLKPSIPNNNSNSGASKNKNKSMQLLNVVVSTEPEKVYLKDKPKAQDQNSKTTTKIQEKSSNSNKNKPKYFDQLDQMAKRFSTFHKLKTQTIKSIDEYEDEENEFDEIIVGKSTRIDKPYLRITGRPVPESVRPLPILQKALAHFLQEYKKGTIYDNLISQFKSIRQDLTVQHIRNSFTVEVYQQNFIISLFENDIIQVKQCQANLWQLYRQGLYHKVDQRNKFIGFHFITLILQEKYKELEYMLTLLPEGTLEVKEIQQSLKLKRIFQLGNYNAFFDYYSNRDEVCRCLLNIYIDKIRMKCLVVVCKTFGQKTKFSWLGEIVGEDQDLLQSLATQEGAIQRQGYFFLKQSYDILIKSDYLVTKKVTNLLG